MLLGMFLCVGKPIYSIDIHPDNSRVATGGQGDGDSGRVVIWNMAPIRDEKDEADAEVPKVLCQMDSHLGCVNCVRWSGNGRFLASGGDDKLVMIWQISRGFGTGKTFGSNITVIEHWRAVATLRAHSGDVLDVAWSSHDMWLATCSVDNTIVVWNAVRLPEQVAVLKGHSGLVKGVTWDPVGKYLASQSDDKTLRIWRTSDWKEESCVTSCFTNCAGTTHVLRLHWSPDGGLIVSAHAMNNAGPTAQIVDRSGWATSFDFVGHRKAVTVVRFNPRIMVKNCKKSPGKLQQYTCCAIGSKDRSLSIWLTSLKRPMVVMHDLFEKSVCDVSWSRMGLELMCCSGDGTAVYMSFEEDEIGIPMSPIEQQMYMEKIFGSIVATNLCGMPTHIVESAVMLNLQQQQQQQQSLEREVSQSLWSAQSRTCDFALSNGDMPFKPRDKQIETRTSDGRRRITPIFLAPQPDIGDVGFIPAPYSTKSIAFKTSTEGSRIVVEKQDRVTQPGLSLSSCSSCSQPHISPRDSSTPFPNCSSGSGPATSCVTTEVNAPVAETVRRTTGEGVQLPALPASPPIQKKMEVDKSIQDTSTATNDLRMPASLSDDMGRCSDVHNMEDVFCNVEGDHNSTDNLEKSILSKQLTESEKCIDVSTDVIMEDNPAMVVASDKSKVSADDNPDIVPTINCKTTSTAIDKDLSVALEKDELTEMKVSVAKNINSDDIKPCGGNKIVESVDQVIQKSKEITNEQTARVQASEKRVPCKKIGSRLSLKKVRVARGRPRKVGKEASQVAMAASFIHKKLAVSPYKEEEAAQLSPMTKCLHLPVANIDKFCSRLVEGLAGTDNSVSMEIENNISVGGLKVHQCRYIHGGKEKWKQMFSSRVVAVDGSRYVACLACENRTLNLFASNGFRLLPPLMLGSPVSVLKCSGHYVTAITSHGYLHIWNTKLRNSAAQPQSLSTIMTTGDKIAQSTLTNDGTVLVALCSGKSFCFSPEVGSWMLVGDQDDIIHMCSDHHRSMPSKVKAGPLASVQGTGGLVSNRLSKVLTANIHTQHLSSVSYLESQIASCLAVRSPSEYRFWLETYVRYIAQEGMEDRLRAICDDLLGPLFTAIKASSSSWCPTILGVSKREILRRILSTIASNLRWQRLYTEYQEQLDMIAVTT